MKDAIPHQSKTSEGLSCQFNRNWDFQKHNSVKTCAAKIKAWCVFLWLSEMTDQTAFQKVNNVIGSPFPALGKFRANDLF